MSTTYHKTKDDVTEIYWQKLKEVGAIEGLIAYVSGQTLSKVPPTDGDDYAKMVDAIIECAWRQGFGDALSAMEMGALKGVVTTILQGAN